MRAGRFGAAWAISDAVLRARDPATRDDPALPYHLRWLWDGQGVDGRHVLVRCYHGLGDTVQFCRFLPLLRPRVASLTLEAQPELVPLLRTVPGLDRVIPFRPDAPAPPMDCTVEIMELAHLLRSPPSGAPFLRAAPLPRWPRGFWVGLCWRAGEWSPGRSVPLRALAPLGRVPGVRLVSVQRGPGAEELRAPGAPPVLDPGDRSADVMRTVRTLATVDAVVTVDTAVAHLAGALGRPTFLLLPAKADWRWMSGKRSAWYGSVRLYRQAIPGRWAAPLARLRADLLAFARREPGNLRRGQAL